MKNLNLIFEFLLFPFVFLFQSIRMCFFWKQKGSYRYLLTHLTPLFFFFLTSAVHGATCTDIGDLSSISSSYTQTIPQKTDKYYSIEITENGTVNSITISSSVKLKVLLSNQNCEDSDLLDHWDKTDKNKTHTYTGPLTVSTGDILYFTIRNTEKKGDKDVSINIDFRLQ